MYIREKDSTGERKMAKKDALDTSWEHLVDAYEKLLKDWEKKTPDLDFVKSLWAIHRTRGYWTYDTEQEAKEAPKKLNAMLKAVFERGKAVPALVRANKEFKPIATALELWSAEKEFHWGAADPFLVPSDRCYAAWEKKAALNAEQAKERKLNEMLAEYTPRRLPYVLNDALEADKPKCQEAIKKLEANYDKLCDTLKGFADLARKEKPLDPKALEAQKKAVNAHDAEVEKVRKKFPHCCA